MAPLIQGWEEQTRDERGRFGPREVEQSEGEVESRGVEVERVELRWARGAARGVWGVVCGWTQLVGLHFWKVSCGVGRVRIPIRRTAILVFLAVSVSGLLLVLSPMVVSVLVMLERAEIVGPGWADWAAMRLPDST